MLKQLLKLRRPLIPPEQALQIARNECILWGWTWREPVVIKAHYGTWHIRTNTTARGVNAHFTIDQISGKIKQAKYIPR